VQAINKARKAAAEEEDEQEPSSEEEELERKDLSKVIQRLNKPLVPVAL